ncbi:unnamed protein product, partial [Discosporangium mesarthrocarpum]
MGVITGERREAECRRAFRRLEPEKMFEAPRAIGEPIWAYWRTESGGNSSTKAIRSKKKDFVLVPAENLTELQSLEHALRRERNILKTQCLLSLDQGKVSACQPLEVIRMAVHSACKREMAAALKDYRSWVAKQKEEGLDGGCCDTAYPGSVARLRTTPARFISSPCPVYCNSGQELLMNKLERERTKPLTSIPVGQRVLRWSMMRQHVQRRLEREERDSMTREEMTQRHTERFLEAQERMHDYNLYCTLAGQFWPLSEEEFCSGDRPGRKLFLMLDRPTRVIIKMWRQCWPFRKARKSKGSIALQALWRGYQTRRRWRPLVRLRLRHGRLAHMRRCYGAWLQWARGRLRARRMFEELRGRAVARCYEAWQGFVAASQAERTAKLEKASRTLRNIAAYRAFQSWAVYWRASRQCRRMFVRAVVAPTLTEWMQFTAEARERRRDCAAATQIQRVFRGF